MKIIEGRHNPFNTVILQFGKHYEKQHIFAGNMNARETLHLFTLRLKKVSKL